MVFAQCCWLLVISLLLLSYRTCIDGFHIKIGSIDFKHIYDRHSPLFVSIILLVFRHTTQIDVSLWCDETLGVLC